MCQFFNDRYSRCGHEKEKETIACIHVQNAMQTKYCSNSKVNTTNTYIEQRCEACKSSNGLVAVPIFPEYDYARLTVKRLQPREMYAKPGEKVVFRPSIRVTEPSPGPSRSATPALNTHGESKKEGDFEREGVLVSPPSEADEPKENKNKKKSNDDIEKSAHPVG